MNLRALETLALIARVGSFTAAAEEANMTLSAVSMQMKTLEQELDVALFDRNSRPPRLTPVGRRVAEHAGRMLLEEAALREACAEGTMLGGHFRIGVILSAAVRCVPVLLQRASRHAPKARFDLITGLSDDLQAGVLSGRLDAGIVTRVGEDDPRLNFDLVSLDEMVVAAPVASGATSLEDAIERLRFLHFNPFSGIGKLTARALKDRGLAPRNVLTLDNVAATVECVCAGLGFTILPEPDVRRHASSELIMLPMGTQRVWRELALVTRDDPSSRLWRLPLLWLLTGGKEPPRDNPPAGPEASEEDFRPR